MFTYYRKKLIAPNHLTFYFKYAILILDNFKETTSMPISIERKTVVKAATAVSSALYPSANSRRRMDVGTTVLDTLARMDDKTLEDVVTLAKAMRPLNHEDRGIILAELRAKLSE